MRFSREAPLGFEHCAKQRQSILIFLSPDRKNDMEPPQLLGREDQGIPAGAPPGIWKLLKPYQGLFCFAPKGAAAEGLVGINIGDGVQKLRARRGGEKDFQRLSLLRRISASARTASRSYPLPASISFSPRTKRRRISNSCCECS